MLNLGRVSRCIPFWHDVFNSTLLTKMKTLSVALIVFSVRSCREREREREREWVSIETTWSLNYNFDGIQRWEVNANVKNALSWVILYSLNIYFSCLPLTIMSIVDEYRSMTWRRMILNSLPPTCNWRRIQTTMMSIYDDSNISSNKRRVPIDRHWTCPISNRLLDRCAVSWPNRTVPIISPKCCFKSTIRTPMVRSISPRWSISSGKTSRNRDAVLSQGRTKSITDELSAFRTVVDASREEQIVSLYQALRGSNKTLSRDQLIELLIMFREDLQSKPSSINQASLNTDDDIRRRAEECLRYYQKSSEGFSLQQLMDYFLGSREPLAMQVKASWNARMDRDEEKKKKKKDFLSSSLPARHIKRSTSAKSSAPNQMQRDTQSS